MGNKIHSPALSYDVVCSSLSSDELQLLKTKYKELCGNEKGGGHGLLDIDTFMSAKSHNICPHLVKNFLPRIFCVISGGKETKSVKFEDYVGALALFRVGSQEEKLKC